MVFVKLLYALLLPLITGLAVVNLIQSRREDLAPLERLAIGFPLGMMIITMEMFYLLSPLNIKYSITSITLPLLLIIFPGVYVSIKNRLFNLNFTQILRRITKPIQWVLLLLIIFQIFLVFGLSLIKPVVGVDAWSVYSLRAKVYFIEGTVIVPTMPKTERGQHVALAQTWIFTSLGEWHDILGKVVFPFYYLCLLIVFYYAARGAQGLTVSLLTTFMLSSLPFLFLHASLEYTDFPLALFYFIGAGLMLRWFGRQRWQDFAFSLIFLLSILTIKNEALFHLAICFVVFLLAVYVKPVFGGAGFKYLRPATLSVLFFGIAYIARTLFFSSNEALKYNSSLDLARLGPLIGVFVDYIFTRNNWGFVWPLLIILIIFNYRKLKGGVNQILIFWVVFEFAGFMAYYFFSGKDIYSWLFFVTPAIRNMLQFMPLTLLLISNLLSFEGLILFRKHHP